MGPKKLLPLELKPMKEIQLLFTQDMFRPEPAVLGS